MAGLLCGTKRKKQGNRFNVRLLRKLEMDKGKQDMSPRAHCRLMSSVCCVDLSKQIGRVPF